MLIPFRDSVGQSLVPSDSLGFMLELFGVDTEVILNLDIAADRAAAQFIAVAEDRAASPRCVCSYADLQLKLIFFILERTKTVNLSRNLQAHWNR